MDEGITDKNRVPGGITGYYQSFKNTRHAQQTECDRFYANYYSTHSGLQIVFFDILIIFRTFRVIVRAKGV